MTDDTADLDRLLARLVEEDRRLEDSDEHPAAERLAAYQAKELSPDENENVQEHVVSCSLCAERLLDLGRFLDPPLEDRLVKGVADFETAAEWRDLRQRIEPETNWKRSVAAESRSRGFFASVRGGYSVAAALLVVTVVLGAWNSSLVRKSRQPVAVRTVRTLFASGSLRSTQVPVESEPPILLPAQITLNLPTETPGLRYRVELLPEGSRRAAASFETSSQESEISFLLPEESLTPGHYSLRAQGLRRGRPSPDLWTYELTIGSSKR